MVAPLLYLASASPRRRQLLMQLGFDIECVAASINETPQPLEAADAYVMRMAVQKNAAARAQWLAKHGSMPMHPLLSADTTVALGDTILGKPEDVADAEHILRMLSASTHQVYSAVCVWAHGQAHTVLQCSDVTFKTLSDEEIQAYIASGEPMDKAGAYGIQGLGGVFVSHLSGSFTGVMGLPVHETVTLLQKLGLVWPVRHDSRGV